MRRHGRATVQEGFAAGAGGLLPVLVLSLAAGCAGGTREVPPRLLPIPAQRTAVGRTLTVDLSVENPSGLPLTFSWTGPDLPGMAESVHLSATPFGARFLYTPLASHTGDQAFEVRVVSRAGEDRQAFVVTVAPDDTTAPSFLRPGPGATFDLSRESCVRVDVEVRDEDSRQVTLAATGDVPPSAEFVQTGPKTGEWTWCPGAAELDRSLQWRFFFEADDGDHPPVRQPFLAVLLRPGKDDCPGSAPEVAFLSPGKGERVASVTGYPVAIRVTDDQGLRDPPAVLWMRGEPEDTDHPDLGEFQALSVLAEGDRFVARVPHLGLAPEAEEVVSLLVVATDNDDASGTACDHRTVSRVHRFLAVGGDFSRDAGGTCSPCDLAEACHSGVCLRGALEGRCVPACPADCPDGRTCARATALDGRSASVCESLEALCPSEAEPSSCADDPDEPDDGIDRAAAWDLAPRDRRMCPEDRDWMRLSVPGPGWLTLSLRPVAWESGDADLVLRDGRGQQRAIAAANGPSEDLRFCTDAASDWFVEVAGNAEARGSWRIAGTFQGGSCCQDDPFEPDGGPDEARPLPFPGLGEGVICPYDSDWFRLEVPSVATVEVTLVSEDRGVDLDLQVFGPAGTLVAFGDALGDETIAWDARPGTHWIRVFGYQGHTDAYLVETDLSPAPSCGTDRDCPLGTSCWDRSCGESFCRNDADCPGGSACPFPGPGALASLCGAPCTKNADCRDGEACKAFPEGRFCGIKGSGANGDACDTFLDCGGQRACLPWPGGCCARAGCRGHGDCEGGTWCVVVRETPACLPSCDPATPACRQSEGYSCRAVPDGDGIDRWVCVP